MSELNHWWRLRQLRASRPGRTANDSGRLAQFQAAMEQSEQFFAAAAAAPITISPLLVFYGLSQAARALLAVHQSTDNWNVRGHGIACRNSAGPLTAITVEDQNSGLFRSFAQLSSSPSYPTAVELEPLVRGLPCGVDIRPFAESNCPAPLLLVSENYTSAGVLVLGNEASGNIGPIPHEIEPTNHGVRDYLNQYPTLTPFRFREVGWVHAEEPSVICRSEEGWATKLFWAADHSLGSEVEQSRLVNSHSLAPVETQRQRLVPPRMPGNVDIAAPLVHWWGVLYALSTLVRYEPVRWSMELDVDRSVDAAGLECLVRAAIEELPGLIRQALHSPTAWRPGSDQDDLAAP